MNGKYLQRLIELSKRTGDTLIVADPQGENSVVLMPVQRYEDLVCGNEVFEDFDDAENFQDHGSSEESWEIPEEFLAPDISTQSLDQQEQSAASVADEREQGEQREEIASNFLPEPMLDEIMQAEIPNLPVEEFAEEGRIGPLNNQEDDDGEERFYLEPIE
jgi:hypothetical protein